MLFTLRKKLILSTVVLIGIVASCSEQTNNSDILLTKVGNRSLYLSEVLSTISDEELKADSTAAVNNYVDAWEKRVVLRNEAERLGLHQNPLIKKELNDLHDIVLSDAMIRMYLNDLDTVSISDDEWKVFVSLNPWVIKISEPSVQVFRFEGSDKDSLDTYRSKILAKQDKTLLSELKISQAEWFLEQQMPISVRQLESEFPSLTSFWRTSRPGDVTPMMRFNNSTQFFWLVQRLDTGSVLDTTLVRPYIEDWLLLQKKNRKLKALEENLMVNARQNKLIQRAQINTKQ